MALTAIFGVLFVAAAFALIGSIKAHVDTPDLLAQIGTVIGLALAFLSSLAQSSLRVYFIWQRLRLQLDARAVARLAIVARFDNVEGTDTALRLAQFLGNAECFHKPATTLHRDSVTVHLSRSDGLNFSICVEGQETSFDGRNHVQLRTSLLELPPLYAVSKVSDEILPLLSSIRSFLGADNCAYQLSLQFERQNPFFAIYIAHLQPDQIGEFRVILNHSTHQPDKTDRVEIRKQSLSIQTSSTENLARLANDFILLSPNLKSLGL